MSVADYVIRVAALVAALGVIWRAIVLPSARWARRMEQYVEFIESQMRHNGGTSVKDTVERIDKRTARLEKAVFPEENNA